MYRKNISDEYLNKDNDGQVSEHQWYLHRSKHGDWRTQEKNRIEYFASKKLRKLCVFAEQTNKQSWQIVSTALKKNEFFYDKKRFLLWLWKAAARLEDSIIAKCAQAPS